MDNKPYDEKADTYSFALLIWSMVRVLLFCAPCEY